MGKLGYDDTEFITGRMVVELRLTP